MHLYANKGIPFDNNKKVNSPSQKLSLTISFEAFRFANDGFDRSSQNTLKTSFLQ